MAVVWMWNVKCIAKIFTILFLLYSLAGYLTYKLLPIFIHIDNAS